MRYFNYIFITYVLAAISIPVANFFNLDIQVLFRFPLINIRYYDIALIIMLIATFSANFTSTFKEKTKVSIIFNYLVLIFGIFLFFNFVRTFGEIELNAQLSFLFSYLSIFIAYYIINFLNKEDIILIIKKNYPILIFAIFFIQLSILFLFFSGQAVIHQDIMGQRVLFDVRNRKEVISIINVIVFIFLSALFRKELFGGRKILNFILSSLIVIIILASSLSFHRGLLFSLVISFLTYFLYSYQLNFKRVFSILLIVLIIVLTFNYSIENFEKAGINPIQNIINTFEYATDTENPNWDKGRDFSRMLAIQLWNDNFWFGIGFNYMHNFIIFQEIATPHHLIITSLMYNGLIGTIIFLSLYTIFYYKTFKLYVKLRRKIINEDERIICIILVVTSVLWLVPALTQEIQTERYSSALQYIFFGAIIKIDDYYELQSKNR